MLQCCTYIALIGLIDGDGLCMLRVTQSGNKDSVSVYVIVQVPCIAAVVLCVCNPSVNNGQNIICGANS